MTATGLSRLDRISLNPTKHGCKLAFTSESLLQSELESIAVIQLPRVGLHRSLYLLIYSGPQESRYPPCSKLPRPEKPASYTVLLTA